MKNVRAAERANKLPWCLSPLLHPFVIINLGPTERGLSINPGMNFSRVKPPAAPRPLKFTLISPSSLPAHRSLWRRLSNIIPFPLFKISCVLLGSCCSNWKIGFPVSRRVCVGCGSWGTFTAPKSSFGGLEGAWMLRNSNFCCLIKVENLLSWNLLSWIKRWN